jgi:hypothetical protein
MTQGPQLSGQRFFGDKNGADMVVESGGQLIDALADEGIIAVLREKLGNALRVLPVWGGDEDAMSFRCGPMHLFRDLP